ncbi:MAG: 1-acyl-sn-glycerol-3-phosphate acyltransferase [Rhodobiaceae bacterium]|nr:1-acyl-sn-glycerol-3-phosphate acyltransferase [Rhodobiaceae bacterium]
MLLIRSTLFNLAFYLNTTIMMIVFSVSFVMPRRPGFIIVKTWCWSCVWLLRLIAGIRMEVRGRENLPEGGFIVAAKHQSALETFALITLLDFPTYILKRQLNWVPLFGWYLIKFGMIPIDRSKGSKAIRDMTEHAKNALAHDRQIIIFPEGTRRSPGAPPQYKVGVARLYAETGATCVPIALDTGLYWPRRSWLRYPGTVRFEILPPIEPGMTVEACLRTIEERIETACERLYREAARDPSPSPLATALAARPAQ